jgi:hypothetical protein
VIAIPGLIEMNVHLKPSVRFGCQLDFVFRETVRPPQKG